MWWARYRCAVLKRQIRNAVTSRKDSNRVDSSKGDNVHSKGPVVGKAVNRKDPSNKANSHEVRNKEARVSRDNVLHKNQADKAVAGSRKAVDPNRIETDLRRKVKFLAAGAARNYARLLI